MLKCVNILVLKQSKRSKRLRDKHRKLVKGFLENGYDHYIYYPDANLTILYHIKKKFYLTIDGLEVSAGLHDKFNSRKCLDE